MNECSGNARKLWNRLSCLIGRKKKLPVQDDLNAGIFLNSFRDKVEKVYSTTPGSQPPQYSVFTGIKLETFSKITIAGTDNSRTQQNMRTGSDNNWNGTEFCIEQLAPFIMLIFNRSLEEDFFPWVFQSCWDYTGLEES